VPVGVKWTAERLSELPGHLVRVVYRSTSLWAQNGHPVLDLMNRRFRRQFEMLLVDCKVSIWLSTWLAIRPTARHGRMK
jgi:hypothetical protein